jgi:hypothetical protein
MLLHGLQNLLFEKLDSFGGRVGTSLAQICITNRHKGKKRNIDVNFI